VRVFPEGWTDDVARFVPQSIAGQAGQFEALVGIARPTHALIVMRREWEPGLSAAARQRFWRAFRVPLFEQILAEDGTLLAAECEAHCGLHIESNRFAAGDHEIDRSQCGCGKWSARLIVVPQMVRHVAASGG
jgi:hypothetical protein